MWGSPVTAVRGNLAIKSLRSVPCAAALLVSGCTTVPLTDRGLSRTYVGVVRVVVPDRRGDVTAVSASGLGLGWDRGPWLGWNSGSWVTADPAKCQLLVVVRSAVEAANAAQVLRALEGREACVADFTGSFRR